MAALLSRTCAQSPNGNANWISRSDGLNISSQRSTGESPASATSIWQAKLRACRSSQSAPTITPPVGSEPNNVGLFAGKPPRVAQGRVGVPQMNQVGHEAG